MALPPSVCQWNHKLRSMCRSQRMRLSLERQVLNTADRRAFPPSRPGEPAGFSAPGSLVYFYKRCLPSKCWLCCNFGSSIRLCVCLLLSGGGKRLRLLTTGTDWGWAAHTASLLADTVTLVQCVRTQLLFACFWKERKCLLLLLNLCFKCCSSENMNFAPVMYSCLRAAWVICSVLASLPSQNS